MIPGLSAAVVAHLWQSTIVVGLVWVTTIALRQHGARVRYWLWVAASLKFLVPFSWLVTLGAQIEWRTGPVSAQPAAAFVIDRVFVPSVAQSVADLPMIQGAASSSIVPAIATALWIVGIATVCLWWWRQWLPVRAARRAATRVTIDSRAGRDLMVMASPMTMEPGIVGVWRPVLLVPEGLLDQLTRAQVDALIAHERSHVRYRDNLTAAVHMAVEALFWFHPLVWWLERRLIDERERACDEDVLRSGSQPSDYAEGILAVCRLSVGAPLACVAGVTGSDLRRRIESILGGSLSRPLGAGRRWALALAAVAVIGVPIVTGVVNAVPLLTIRQDPSTPVAFAVASVKANKSGERPGTTNDSVPGLYTATNVWVGLLIRYAYEIQDSQLEGPDWIRTLAPERFDVAARLDPAQIGTPAAEARAKRLAMRTLLAERFNLVVRRETREVPMYALTLARSDGRLGPGLNHDSTDCSPEAAAARAAAQPGAPPPGFCGMRVNTGRIQVGGYTMAEFAKNFMPYGRNVLDRTGLAGKWQFVLTYTPDQPNPQPGPNTPAVDPDGPTLLTALQEHLGLKLEPARGSIDVLIVERVERPTEN